MLRIIERATRQQIAQMNLPSVAAVNEQRVARFKQRIADTLASGDADPFRSIVEEFAAESELPAIDIAAALASLLQGSTPLLLPEKHQGEESGREWGRHGEERDGPRSQGAHSRHGRDGGGGGDRRGTRPGDRNGGEGRGRPRDRGDDTRHRGADDRASGADRRPRGEHAAGGSGNPRTEREADGERNSRVRDGGQVDVGASGDGGPASVSIDARAVRVSRRRHEAEGDDLSRPSGDDRVGAGGAPRGELNADRGIGDRNLGGERPTDSDRQPRTARAEGAPEGDRNAGGERDASGDRASTDTGGARASRRRRGDAEDVVFETFRLEVGHAHGVKPGNIVGAIANEAGLEGRHIGQVDIRDDHSFVDLPEGMPKDIFRSLKKVRVVGQELRISRVDGKPR
jgi:ATP-dependent RNA helicase DeaD